MKKLLCPVVLIFVFICGICYGMYRTKKLNSAHSAALEGCEYMANNVEKQLEQTEASLNQLKVFMENVCEREGKTCDYVLQMLKEGRL